jgi:hypothetical protein
MSSARMSEKRWRYNSVDRKFCTGGCEDRIRGRESEESSLLEAAARKQLVKTQQAGKGSAGAVVICKVWRLLIRLLTGYSSEWCV